ncbi:MAG: hypothetical protein WC882_02415 [Candidatus Gracilibacteria bacterium]
MENSITKISDGKLLRLCDQFGRQALLWRRRFIGLLPEVHKRKLYEKRGCASIFEFAAKLAGLSEEQVRRVLCLEKRFEDKPILRNLLVEGRVSVNKLARVASIATVENEKELAEKVKKLPCAAIETLVRDEKFYIKESDFEDKNGLNKSQFDVKTVHVHSLNFSLSDEVIAELNRLHAQGHDVNKILFELLKQRNEKIEQEKEAIAQNVPETASRYIPVRVKSILKEEFGQKCSIPTCQKLAQTIHHSQRFALAHTHDPRYMAPLCREHHQIAHSVDRRYWEERFTSLRA